MFLLLCKITLTPQQKSNNFKNLNHEIVLFKEEIISIPFTKVLLKLMTLK